jgi:hypothetical protein
MLMNTHQIMPDRLVPVLGAACGLLALSYVTLMVTTIFFASWQSQAVGSIGLSESTIGNLESQYYSTINSVSSIDPSSLGFVSPTDVEYVAAASANSNSNLTFAGN